jgi:hypothetical protein
MAFVRIGFAVAATPSPATSTGVFTTTQFLTYTIMSTWTAAAFVDIQGTVRATETSFTGAHVIAHADRRARALVFTDPLLQFAYILACTHTLDVAEATRALARVSTID